MIIKINQQTLLTLILIAVLGGLLFYGGTQGWFKPKLKIVYNTTIIEKLKEVPLYLPSCALSFTPIALFTGDEITGIIQDGAETLCDVYAYDGVDWYWVYSGITDPSGRLASTQELWIEGIFEFRAICGECMTNPVTIYVNPVPEEDDDFHNDFECDAGCGIRGYDFGACSSLEPFDPSIQIGICSEEGNYCWCWNEAEEEGGGGGGGTEPYSSSECEILMDEHGKDFYSIVDSQIECEDYGFDVCNLHETYMESYDWFEPNCCIINCYDYP